eukprot:TRINITY_DN67031_c6_g2_i1.p1 TRINITY_DN67031_c6_g2~~TRINITY_DN67031_c6_g2_i1.p1  ORF type:complete len:403 (+),score=64.20 TRINITY_DN67031_c6_g2_i1:51-1259(+)
MDEFDSQYSASAIMKNAHAIEDGESFPGAIAAKVREMSTLFAEDKELMKFKLLDSLVTVLQWFTQDIPDCDVTGFWNPAVWGPDCSWLLHLRKGIQHMFSNKKRIKPQYTANTLQLCSQLCLLFGPSFLVVEEKSCTALKLIVGLCQVELELALEEILTPPKKAAEIKAKAKQMAETATTTTPTQPADNSSLEGLVPVTTLQSPSTSPARVNSTSAGQSNKELKTDATNDCETDKEETATQSDGEQQDQTGPSGSAEGEADNSTTDKQEGKEEALFCEPTAEQTKIIQACSAILRIVVQDMVKDEDEEYGQLSKQNNVAGPYNLTQLAPETMLFLHNTLSSAYSCLLQYYTLKEGKVATEADSASVKLLDVLLTEFDGSVFNKEADQVKELLLQSGYYNSIE